MLDGLEAHGVIYRRQGSGIYAALGRKSIAVVMASAFIRDPASPVWGLLLGHCVDQCQWRSLAAPEDYHFHVSFPDAEERTALPPDLIRQAAGGTLHGAVGIGIDFSALTAGGSELSEFAIPTVALFGYGDWRIGYDREAVIREGVRRLAERGCRRIG